MMRLLVLLALFSLVTATSAPAQTAAQRAACGADAKRFCAGVTPGGGRLLDCLAKHKSNIAPACQKVLAEMGR